ncbi:hypothetical protein [Pseudomonas sp.]|uniref:LuxE/PaaK family acyltransferase n=1 Tax=Pseudomonas sp. TaxID=306 RepID=UPI003981ABEF
MTENKVGDLIAGKRNDFGRLALEVFEYQYSRAAAYRRLCDKRGVRPDTVNNWQDIPPLPTEAFKGDIGLPAAPAPAHVFLSSGTSSGGQRPSQVQLGSLELYRLAALEWFGRMVLPDRPGPMSVLLLGPTAQTHPGSSLGHMFGWLAAAHGDGHAGRFFDDSGSLDLPATLSWLGQKADDGGQVLVLALSSALTALFGAMREREIHHRLGATSRVVDTGGRKGAAHVLSAKGILKAAWTHLHVPAYMNTNEYGMTEMASQFYDDALLARHQGRLRPRAKLGPPWTRTRVVDPTTLEPVADGEAGLLVHFDLANLETVSCLLSLDLGRKVGDGFELLGRADGAEARGCSDLMAAIEA